MSTLNFYMNLLSYKPHLQNLMQGLLYPAMLGTFIVLYISNYFFTESNVELLIRLDFLYSILLIFYFCLSYLVNESIKKYNIYNAITFLADLLEIFLMYKLFSIIDIENSSTFASNIRNFYWFALFVPAIQIIWNISLGEKTLIYYMLNGISIFLFLVSYQWGFKYEIYNYMLCLFIFSIILFYMLILLKDEEFSD